MIADETKLREIREVLDAICPTDHGYYVLLTPRNVKGNATSSFISNAPVGDWPSVMREAANQLEKTLPKTPPTPRSIPARGKRNAHAVLKHGPSLID